MSTAVFLMVVFSPSLRVFPWMYWVVGNPVRGSASRGWGQECEGRQHESTVQTQWCAPARRDLLHGLDHTCEGVHVKGMVRCGSWENDSSAVGGASSTRRTQWRTAEADMAIAKFLRRLMTWTVLSWVGAMSSTLNLVRSRR